MGGGRRDGEGGGSDSTDVSLSKLQEIVKAREAWRAPVRGAANSWK